MVIGIETDTETSPSNVVEMELSEREAEAVFGNITNIDSENLWAAGIRSFHMVKSLERREDRAQLQNERLSVVLQRGIQVNVLRREGFYKVEVIPPVDVNEYPKFSARKEFSRFLEGMGVFQES